MHVLGVEKVSFLVDNSCHVIINHHSLENLSTEQDVLPPNDAVTLHVYIHVYKCAVAESAEACKWPPLKLAAALMDVSF